MRVSGATTDLGSTNNWADYQYPLNSHGFHKSELALSETRGYSVSRVTRAVQIERIPLSAVRRGSIEKARRDIAQGNTGNRTRFHLDSHGAVRPTSGASDQLKSRFEFQMSSGLVNQTKIYKGPILTRSSALYSFAIEISRSCDLEKMDVSQKKIFSQLSDKMLDRIDETFKAMSDEGGYFSDEEIAVMKKDHDAWEDAHLENIGPPEALHQRKVFENLKHVDRFMGDLVSCSNAKTLVKNATAPFKAEFSDSAI